MAPSAAPAGPAYLLEPTSEQNWHQACKLVNYLLSTVKTNKALLPQDHKKLRMFRGECQRGPLWRYRQGQCSCMAECRL